MMNNVAEGNLVNVHFTLTIEGKIVDSSRGQEPLEFQVGMHQVIPGFEKALKDMKGGEKKTFQLSPDDGYGQEDPNCIREVSRAELPSEIEIEVGMILYAYGPNGQTIPVKIKEIKKDGVFMDFNHTFAGKTLDVT